MTTIQSHMTKAQTYATSLVTASQALSQAPLAGQDDMTTVAGNANAHQAIQLSYQTATGLASLLSQGVSNIQSVASEFEAVDRQLAAGGD